MKIFGNGMRGILPSWAKSPATDPLLDKFYGDLLTGQFCDVGDAHANPWPAVCQVQTDLGEDGSDAGTGFLISECTVVTAAHLLCVAKGGKMVDAQEITVVLGDGRTFSVPKEHRVYHPTYAELARDVSLLPPGVSDAEVNARELARDCFDLAALMVDADPRPSCFLSLRSTERNDPRWDRDLTSGGYPVAASGRLRKAAGKAFPYDNRRFLGGKSNLVVHNAATFKPLGASGGPLFACDSDGSLALVGIQVRSNAGEIYNNRIMRTNGAVCLSQTVLDTLNAWDEGYKNLLALGRRPPEIIA
jgi:V8-like Glu-specific endopeptidase